MPVIIRHIQVVIFANRITTLRHKPNRDNREIN